MIVILWEPKTGPPTASEWADVFKHRLLIPCLIAYAAIAVDYWMRKPPPPQIQDSTNGPRQS